MCLVVNEAKTLKMLDKPVLGYSKFYKVLLRNRKSPYRYYQWPEEGETVKVDIETIFKSMVVGRVSFDYYHGAYKDRLNYGLHAYTSKGVALQHASRRTIVVELRVPNYAIAAMGYGGDVVFSECVVGKRVK